MSHICQRTANSSKCLPWKTCACCQGNATRTADKDKKIFSGVKEKMPLGVLLARPYQGKFYLYSYTLRKLQLVQKDSRKKDFRANIFFNPDDLLPYQCAKVRFAGMSMAFTPWVCLCIIIQKRSHASNNSAPGQPWSTASTRESKRFSTAKLTSSEKFSQMQPDKN